MTPKEQIFTLCSIATFLYFIFIILNWLPKAIYNDILIIKFKDYKYRRRLKEFYEIHKLNFHKQLFIGFCGLFDMLSIGILTGETVKLIAKNNFVSEYLVILGIFIVIQGFLYHILFVKSKKTSFKFGSFAYENENYGRAVYNSAKSSETINRLVSKLNSQANIISHDLPIIFNNSRIFVDAINQCLQEYVCQQEHSEKCLNIKAYIKHDRNKIEIKQELQRLYSINDINFDTAYSKDHELSANGGKGVLKTYHLDTIDNEIELLICVYHEDDIDLGLDISSVIGIIATLDYLRYAYEVLSENNNTSSNNA
jgi:hypothetical protein